jgi:hypothetical protein
VRQLATKVLVFFLVGQVMSIVAANNMAFAANATNTSTQLDIHRSWFGTVGLAPSRNSKVSSEPRLGSSWGSWITGFGHVKPNRFTFGGDGYSQVTDIKWSHWGLVEATATGTGWYVPAGDYNAQGRSEPVTIVAFDLGSCRGVSAYTAIDWYFQTEGGKRQISPHLDICLGDWVQQGCDPTALAAAARPYFRSVLRIEGPLSLRSVYCDGGTVLGQFTSPTLGTGYVIWKRFGVHWRTTFAGAIDTGDPALLKDGVSAAALQSLYVHLTDEALQYPQWFTPVPIPE